nr:hypothetical protein GCM10020185_74440 [Pseudomonas brassicacearum subsp. brassicacearum]
MGMSIAFGLALLGRQVSVLDEGDDAIRAARGNFGLLWVQGKGYRMSPYAQWTRESVALWPRFAAALQADTGIDVHLRQQGGFQLCLSDVEMAEESHRLGWLRDAFAGDYPFELLDATQLRARLPGIGPDVVGGCFFRPWTATSTRSSCCARSTPPARLAGSSSSTVITSRLSTRAPRASNCGQESSAGLPARWSLAAGLGNRTLGGPG